MNVQIRSQCNALWQLYPFAREQLVNVKTRQATKLKGPDCRVLEVLIENKGQVVSKREILKSAWGERVVSDASLTQSIAQIRLALGDNGKEQKYIKTLPSQGYLLYDNVVEMADSEWEIEPGASDGEGEHIFRPSVHNLPKLSVRTPTFNRKVKWLLLLLLMMLFVVQLSGVINRLSFDWNLQVDDWVNVKRASVNFLYQREPASEKLYHYLSSEKRLTGYQQPLDLVISTGVSNYYVSCLYLNEHTGADDVKNFTFSLQESFYFIGGMINDLCR
ncbi:winged helix-turn-helix domain-containing protein [Vibrio brasiliensis]|uniref:winged helix-turn-helix domain-containing protein n=1 Tax=Vibrio brasiliensis TaxID=170652 RepID=UPI001EFE28FF|nr:winged helix-turn-helix domain-containing protein [Vibrio brasiliensis]MCG9784580.1 winged helix-turn-helix domain-containing protein [Vibrio brasiliensis]